MKIKPHRHCNKCGAIVFRTAGLYNCSKCGPVGDGLYTPHEYRSDTYRDDKIVRPGNREGRAIPIDRVIK